MNRHEIKAYIREHGLRGFGEGVDALLRGATLENGAVIRMRPDEFSIRELWEAMKPEGFLDGPIKGISESALDATGFPTVTEKLLSAAFIEGYQPIAPIADSLVPESIVPKTLTERIYGFTAEEGPKIVLPGEQYPTLGFTDKFATFEQALHNKKEGYAVEVLEETIRLDQTGKILSMARDSGMALQTERERRTVRAVLGIGADSGTTINGVYFPSGTDTALYAASRYNYRTNTTPLYNHPGKTADSKLEDYTDFAEVMTTHSTNITDDRSVGTGRPVAWSPDRVLVGTALGPTAANIFQAMGVTFLAPFTAGTDAEIRTNAPNPLQTIFNGSMPIPYASPYVDEVSTTMWAVYDSRRSFVRINIFPFATFRSSAGYGEMRDVLFAVRVREWSRVVAKDYRFSMLNTGAA